MVNDSDLLISEELVKLITLVIWCLLLMFTWVYPQNLKLWLKDRLEISLGMEKFSQINVLTVPLLLLKCSFKSLVNILQVLMSGDSEWLCSQFCLVKFLIRTIKLIESGLDNITGLILRRKILNFLSFLQMEIHSYMILYVSIFRTLQTKWQLKEEDIISQM